MRTLKLNALRFFTLIGLSTLTFNGITQIATGVQVRKPNVNINANCNGYLEYLPPGYDPSTPAKHPLLLFFNGHGTQGPGTYASLGLFFTGGGTPADQCEQGWWQPSFVVNGVTHSFIVITPQFINSFCCTGMPSAGDVDGIINYMISNYKVDPTRIYLTGVSSGGYIPFEYAAAGPQYADRIAAIIPFASTSYCNDQNKANVIRNSGLAVWGFHNQGDINVYPINTISWINAINNPTLSSPPAKATIFPNVTSHICWWDPYMRLFTENGQNIYEWMLGYSRPSQAAPLPVKYSLFNANCINNVVNLTWKTATEINTNNFSVEKSTDNRTWNSIATIVATGQNGTEQTYNYRDNNSGNNNMYRIVANDFDGRKTYSSIIKSSCGEKDLFTVFPNPVIDNAVVNINVIQPTKITLSVIDNKGAVVLKQQATVLAGNNQLSVNMSALAKGTYSLLAQWNDENKTVKIIKQ